MPRKAKAQRQALIEAANRLFYRQGYARTSFTDIAREAGFNRGNFYYYFKTKEEILQAIIEARLTRARAMLESWDTTLATPLERLRRFVRIQLEEVCDVARYGCPMGTLGSELAKGEHARPELVRPMFDLFRSWLERQFSGLGLGPDRAAEQAMRLLVLTQGIAMLGHVYGDEDLVRRETAQVETWLEELAAEADQSGLRNRPRHRAVQAP